MGRHCHFGPPPDEKYRKPTLVSAHQSAKKCLATLSCPLFSVFSVLIAAISGHDRLAIKCKSPSASHANPLNPAVASAIAGYFKPWMKPRALLRKFVALHKEGIHGGINLYLPFTMIYIIVSCGEIEGKFRLKLK